MLLKFAPFGSGKAHFNFANKPCIMIGKLTDKDLDGLEYQRFSFSPLLRRDPGQFAFEFWRKLYFHVVSLEGESRGCQNVAGW